MTDTTQSTTTVDLDLVDQVCTMIPYNTWSAVRDAVVASIVDNMPSDILFKLTGSPDDCDRAEEIVLRYYSAEGRNQDLIIDAFKILGSEYTLHLLDSLQLDKYSNYLETTNENND